MIINHRSCNFMDFLTVNMDLLIIYIDLQSLDMYFLSVSMDLKTENKGHFHRSVSRGISDISIINERYNVTCYNVTCYNVTCYIGIVSSYMYKLYPSGNVRMTYVHT